VRSAWWANYNVRQVLTGVQDNAWEEMCLLEDIRRQEKRLDAEARRKRWLEDYRTGLISLEGEMAWNVISFDYVIAGLRQDMDNAHRRSRDKPVTMGQTSDHGPNQ
jgi:hypothetical protein